MTTGSVSCKKHTGRKIFTGLLFALLLSVMMAAAAHADWVKNSQGTRYYKGSSYLTGWQTIDGSKYYFDMSTGYMAVGKKTIDGITRYFDASGKLRTGIQYVSKWYFYFGSNGRIHTGWQTVKTGSKTYKYYFGKSGKMQFGFITYGKNGYYLNAKTGRLTYGLFAVDGKKYYANTKSGALARNMWVGRYYFQDDYTMAVDQWIDGKYVGPNGRWTGQTGKVGWVTEGGVTRYYNKNQKMVKGWLTLSGKTYYLSESNGALQKGWFTVGSKRYYSDSNGVMQTGKWMGKRYLTASGYMATGWQTIGSNTYYFNLNSGERVTGWYTISKKVYYFDANGVMQKNKFLKYNGNYYWLSVTGERKTGFVKIKNRFFYLSEKENGKVLYKWFTVNGKKYYAHKSLGWLFRNTFFTRDGHTYYAQSDCSMATGLKKIDGKLYCFTTSNAWMVKNSRYTVSGATYYFGSDGKLKKSGTADGYYINSDGSRGDRISTRSGWQTINGKKYYYQNGKAVTGWQTISSAKYYFDGNGVMQTGLKTIGGKKYYFDSNGVMAVSTVIVIGDKQYTIDANGVVTNETSTSVPGNTLGSKMAKYALNYVGNPYVWGGTSLTNGADCSGFVYTIHANHGISIPRVANDQMYGSNAYKFYNSSALQPGDLVFYGSSGYASHVAMYIGNGEIVHASNSQPYPAGGIKVSNYDYRTPIGYARYWQ